MLLHPFPNEKILDSSKLKEFPDDNFKLHENGGKLSIKRVENTLGKVKIAHYEHFPEKNTIWHISWSRYLS